MYPNIFLIAIKGLGQNTKKASSYLVMAIVGGALSPLVMGKLSDATNIQHAYLKPAVCFTVVLYFAISQEKQKAVIAAQSN